MHKFSEYKISHKTCDLLIDNNWETKPCVTLYNTSGPKGEALPLWVILDFARYYGCTASRRLKVTVRKGTVKICKVVE